MPDRRVEEYAGGADFAWVSNALSERRDEILERWLDAAASQPFHDGRREHAVADHIPHLFDALLGLLNTTGPSLDRNACAPGRHRYTICGAEVMPGCALSKG